MSLVQFDEMYDICCEMMKEEVRLVNVNPTIERLELTKDCIPDSNRWWEAAIREIQTERELLYV